jgi:hypothetical protein
VFTGMPVPPCGGGVGRQKASIATAACWSFVPSKAD